jgi:hypothetical protein
MAVRIRQEVNAAIATENGAGPCTVRNDLRPSFRLLSASSARNPVKHACKLLASVSPRALGGGDLAALAAPDIRLLPAASGPWLRVLATAGLPPPRHRRALPPRCRPVTGLSEVPARPLLRNRPAGAAVCGSSRSSSIYARAPAATQ